jgi:tRNA-2-methylthio-N6-dimethylallyladenosine synthase
MPNLYIHTFGCQMNVRDSERITAFLATAGYTSVEEESRADLVIVNTCSIRNKAEEKVYSLLGRLEKHKLRSPDLILAVGGCVAEQEGDKLLRRFPGLDLVFGTHQIALVPQLVLRTRQGERVCSIGSLPNPERLRGYSYFNRSPGVSTFITIMEGCNNWCSYCVVPALRGREVCRPAPEILAEVQALTEKGFREITLIGQNVNSYYSEDGLGFPQLLQMVADIPGILRLRFATSHPKDLHDDLIQAFTDTPRLAHHLHLPVQSGSSRILESMNRNYTREDYLEKVARVRAACPDIAITTDMIIGFPGESDSDFQQTLDLLEEAKFDGSFSFCYSPRPNTRAASLNHHVNNQVARNRLQVFQARQDEITRKINQSLVEQVHLVLPEGLNSRSRNQAELTLTGRTSTNKIIHFAGSSDLIGYMVPVRITAAATHSLSGTIDSDGPSA